EPEEVVLDRVVVVRASDRTLEGGDLGERPELLRVETPPSQTIDRLVLGGLDEPRDRLLRAAVARPLLDRSGERLLQRLLGEIEVTEAPDEGRPDRPRFAPVESIDVLTRTDAATWSTEMVCSSAERHWSRLGYPRPCDADRRHVRNHAPRISPLIQNSHP